MRQHETRESIWLSATLFVILAMTASYRAAADETATAEKTDQAAAAAEEEEKTCACGKDKCDGECKTGSEAKCDCEGECKGENKAGKDEDSKAASNGKVKLTAATKTANSKAKGSADKKGKDEGDKDEKSKTVRLANIVISGGLPEAAGGQGPTPFGDLGTDIRQTIARLDKVAGDDKVEGLLLEIKSPAIGRGRLNEFRQAIDRVRKSGKKVHVYLESAGPLDYMLACSCDEITIPEPGEVMIPGLYLEASYYRGLLDKLGIKADFMHMGEAKGAAEPFTRRKMSPAVRENLTNMVDDHFNQMLECIAGDRGIPTDKVRELIDEGIISASAAKEAGLIDRVAYADELRCALEKSYSADKLVYVLNYGKKKVDKDFSGTMGLIKLMQAMMGVETPKKGSKGKKIAVVYAVGPIMSGKSQSSIFGGQTMGSETIVKALKEAADDEKVAAIVLRIDSPGGSALASDMIWRQTKIVGKPIVASMSDVAASGGYYIAMGCDKIYAEPGTLTGSIGVVGGKMALRGMYNKIGVTTSVISRGKNAALFSATDKWNPSERAAIERLMRDVYKQFTSKVAEGRHMPLERVLELAGGRVYTGRDAKQNGLVDELGTLKDAIGQAKSLAGIGKDEKVELELLPETPNFFEALFGDMDEERDASLAAVIGLPSARLAKELPPEILEPLRKAARLRIMLRDRISLVMPFDLEVK